MSRFLPTERAETFRNPSTANFLIDSQDRTSGSGSSDFLINKSQALMNGFFTRLAPTEVVLDWCVDNITAVAGNSSLSIIVAGTPYTAVVPDGQYTVKLLLDTLVISLNALAIAGHTFSISAISLDVPGKVSLLDSNAAGFLISSSRLQRQLNFQLAVSPQQSFPVNCPQLQLYTYIDFVSPQLTYCQDLKDTSTTADNKDVLFRWNFAEAGATEYDAYGYAILQGYRNFGQLRAISFPKQIRWNSDQAIGQVSFQVYGSDSQKLPQLIDFDWRMTLLVSEN